METSTPTNRIDPSGPKAVPRRRRRRAAGAATLLAIGLFGVTAAAAQVWKDRHERPGGLAALGHRSADPGRHRASPAHRSGADAERVPPSPATPSPSPTPSTPPLVKHASGTLVTVQGDGPVLGTGGTLVRYAVDVEQGLPEDPVAFAATVERILGDPRSWGHGGQYRFQRVATGPVRFRVTLAAPDEVDKLCSELDTNGYTSCRQGNRSVINQNRWESAVSGWPADLLTYQDYVINHEVGHALGHGHQHCPGAGRPAPVMQQQTLNLEGCVPNGWPFP
jgi:hypothetical protein